MACILCVRIGLTLFYKGMLKKLFQEMYLGRELKRSLKLMTILEIWKVNICLTL
jgi:hypothetical protein